MHRRLQAHLIKLVVPNLSYQMTSHVPKRKPISKIGRLKVLWYLSLRKQITLASVAALFMLGIYKLVGIWHQEYELMASTALVVIVTAGVAMRFAEKRTIWHLMSLKLNPIDTRQFENCLHATVLPCELVRSGYEINVGGKARNNFTGTQFIAASATSTQVNRALWKATSEQGNRLRVSINFDGSYGLFHPYRKWTAPARAVRYLVPIIAELRTQHLANELKVRLRKDLLLSSTGCPLQLEIEQTDYFADLATGQLTGTTVEDHNGYEEYDGYSFAYAKTATSNQLCQLNASQCSNQIGVSCLAIFLSHNTLGVQVGDVRFVTQGQKSIQSAGLLAPSGSGSIDWSDFIEHGDEFIAAAMLRELLEEQTIGRWRPNLTTDLYRVALTGFGRMLHRGGKPEFYGLVVLDTGKLVAGRDKAETAFVDGYEIFPLDSLDSNSLRNTLVKFRVTHGERFSHPLHLCIDFALTYIDENPESLEAFVSSVGAR